MTLEQKMRASIGQLEKAVSEIANTEIGFFVEMNEGGEVTLTSANIAAKAVPQGLYKRLMLTCLPRDKYFETETYKIPLFWNGDINDSGMNFLFGFANYDIATDTWTIDKYLGK